MPDNEINPVLGIDLGTTFTAMARWDGRGPVVYKTAQGKESLQSVVFYESKDGGEIIVGDVGYKKGLVSPEKMAQGVKRQMDDGSQIVSIGGRQFSPIELSALILRRFYDDVAGNYPEGKFQGSRGTVVTVPYSRSPAPAMTS